MSSPTSRQTAAGQRRQQAKAQLAKLSAFWDEKRIGHMTYGDSVSGPGQQAASSSTPWALPAAASNQGRAKVALLKENAEREQRRKKEQERFEQAERQRRKRTYMTRDLTQVLNELMADWATTAEGRRAAAHRATLPLEIYASHELLWPDTAEIAGTAGQEGLSLPGAGLVLGGGGGGGDDRGKNANLGIWKQLVINGVNEATGHYSVVWKDSGAAATLHPIYVALGGGLENRFHVLQRITDALVRRRDAEVLMRYDLFIEHMPISPSVVASLGQQQASRILTLALIRSAAKVDADAITEQLEQVQHEYEKTMNKLIFDVNMQNADNIDTFRLVALPPRPPRGPIPLLGVVETPPHDFKLARAEFCMHSFQVSREALLAAIEVRAHCVEVEKTALFVTTHTRPLSCVEYTACQHDALMAAVRLLKEEWPTNTARAVRAILADADPEDYNIDEIYLRHYNRESNPLRRLLARANLVMTDTLCGVEHNAVGLYEAYVLRCCSWDVRIEGTSKVTCVFNGRDVTPQPLFMTAVIASPVKRVMNGDAVQESERRICEWLADKDNEGQECPIEKRYVMERLFWSRPALVGSVPLDDEVVAASKQRSSDAVKRSCEPLMQYLKAFEKHHEFLNLDVAEYVGGLKHASVTSKDEGDGDDDDDDDDEAPVRVELSALRGVLDRHRSAIAQVEGEIPADAVACGLFQVDASAIRSSLIAKHKDILRRVLESHAEHTVMLSSYINQRFGKIEKRLQVQPANIEETCALEESIEQVEVTLSALSDGIQDVVKYCEVLEDFWFMSDSDEHIRGRWTAVGWPVQIVQARRDAEAVCTSMRERYLVEMVGEQERFASTLAAIETEVSAFADLYDLANVQDIAAQVRAVEEELNQAEQDAARFNAREGLFERDITEYDMLWEAKKNLEPYANLWKTAQDWMTMFKAWTTVSFTKLDAEDIESKTESMYSAISKALKYFERAEMGNQKEIAAQIKQKIAEFKPNNPTIIALRNPGMRERHWEDISAQLGFSVVPNEEFTLKNVLSLNLTEYLPIIEKVSESAAKEYQIEVALRKMQEEWETIELEILPYRETGTYLLRGIDEISALLDEHVTMTQAMQFSAFKGPFEERIDAWNAKLYMVSEVLEAWLAVQRNWLYLQPIFESPDINKQLPAEGKKFASVDKAWRSSLSAAKQNPQAISFCDSEKLLERFREGAALLDQVQKGLSDYLETKRGAFARFYFLSNEELLSILSESKDVKAVQPHLKKCFENIDKVRFEANLEISALISPEGEQIALTKPVDPNGKNVEHWMLELEAAMRESCRDVMEAAVLDYPQTPRIEWMQKHVAMCVLNGSQMHWTLETEDLFDHYGEEGPSRALKRQISQLDDMVILVRSDLPKSTRTTVGALTVIDVHARDVMQKLVDQGVASAAEFLWTSQMRYYWQESHLWAEMVAARMRYGYEYLGNTFRLVITPLTDKCYLTLMGALQMTLGGAPAGPAGTGKTETTKDLGKALAQNVIVFNC
eukprot:scaffold4124_cov252-Pinguiococcus_pyrenoidosus.AAC.6